MKANFIHGAVLFSCLAAATVVKARNLESRAGFGVSLHDYGPTPALSLRYHFSNYLSATGLLGFNTDSSQNNVILGGKLYQNAHLEENINFYVGLGGFIVSGKGGLSDTASGLELQGLIGGEFFLSGLPNLGIQFETGIAVLTVRNVVFKTLGNGFMGTGIHYYF